MLCAGELTCSAVGLGPPVRERFVARFYALAVIYVLAEVSVGAPGLCIIGDVVISSCFNMGFHRPRGRRSTEPTADPVFGGTDDGS